MPLPATASDRELAHSRTISFKGYKRVDGLWDVEGHLLDVRPQEAAWPGGGRAANEPIHSMFLRLTVDETGVIKDVAASTDASPFEGMCGKIVSVYTTLVGTRVGTGFRRNVLQLVGDLNGCTHMTELLLGMGTAVLQTLAGEIPLQPDRKPFNLDGCHALDTSGEIVAKFYPLWYRARAVSDSVKNDVVTPSQDRWQIQQ
ncbi:DUF2889 domain-containing protein [Noviherbaspirillum saxi]|uniref:DUF2889 domain-containing protein n=1 Tax=Noviherbaspirillum saxi TaxID=2320863 RepID=A0A3A3FL19_9BURK|nr:DUF2889 domain-containing protein [Noviherbaspirillum saxi]RJF95421.1 DUF2889 domain-containing protein [Noviherbaspirillum saxi]